MEVKAEAISYTQNSENVDRPMHPLKYSWCLWFLDGESTSTSWEERLDRVAAVSTLEDYICWLIRVCTDLYFFKRGIRPLWDDPANVNGGRWILSMGDNMGRMDAVWMHLLICLVGSWFRTLQAQICGVVANVRKRKSKICVWTNCASEKAKTIKIGYASLSAVKEFLKIQDVMVYEVHEGRRKVNHKFLLNQTDKYHSSDKPNGKKFNPGSSKVYCI
ncbi:IF4E domain containing protein [Trichuris trichiura]|uniref:IF4E domain containing protein n=1 Tax=Trichuris trichiura TaxID=36087 RepID=A0A077Z6B8_TRITR|nr:IF4E domain containing protein [Trichuris trichiura]